MFDVLPQTLFFLFSKPIETSAGQQCYNSSVILDVDLISVGRWGGGYEGSRGGTVRILRESTRSISPSARARACVRKNTLLEDAGAAEDTVVEPLRR